MPNLQPETLCATDTANGRQGCTNAISCTGSTRCWCQAPANAGCWHQGRSQATPWRGQRLICGSPAGNWQFVLWPGGSPDGCVPADDNGSLMMRLTFLRLAGFYLHQFTDAILSFSQGHAQPFLRTPQGRPVYNISMKLFGNATPAMLPPDLREEVLSWLETAPHNLDGYLREGCVHLSIDLTFSTDEDYASAIQSVPAGFLASVYSAKAKWPWRTCPTTVWLPDRVIHAEEGKIVANAPCCQSNSLELISAEVVTHRSIESNKVCRFLSLRSYDLKVPGVTVLLRSPVHGWWQKLAAYCQETKQLATSIGHQTCGSRYNSSNSGSTESENTCFEVSNGGVHDVTCSVEVPDHVVQDGLAFVEIVVDGDVGQHRQSRPIAVLLQQPQHEPVAL